MHWTVAQHLHTSDWPIQPKSCSTSGTGIINVHSCYITTVERTEQISKEQESFTEQDDTARSCLTNREWHVVIRVGVLPWASEISYHLGELWKRAGRGLMNVAWWSAAWKSVRHHEQVKQTKSAVKREAEGSEREEVVWEMRGEARLRHERGPSTHGGPHHAACGRQRDPAHSSRFCEDHGAAKLWAATVKHPSASHQSSLCLHQSSHRLVSMGKGTWSLLC